MLVVHHDALDTVAVRKLEKILDGAVKSGHDAVRLMTLSQQVWLA